MLSEAYQRCSLVVSAVALLRSLLRSALLRSSLNEPLPAFSPHQRAGHYDSEHQTEHQAGKL